MPSPGKIKEGGFRRDSGNRKNWDEEKDGDDTEKTLVTNCDQRRHRIAGHDLLLDDKLRSSAERVPGVRSDI